MKYVPASPIYIVVAIVAAALLLPGCSEPPSTQDSGTSEFTQDLKDTLHDAKRLLEQKLDPVAEDWQAKTSKEIEKLFALEYRVVTLDAELDSDAIEAELNDLGKERWECFSIRPDTKGLRVYCKRRPRSYLRYLGRMGRVL